MRTKLLHKDKGAQTLTKSNALESQSNDNKRKQKFGKIVTDMYVMIVYKWKVINGEFFVGEDSTDCTMPVWNGY